MTRSKAKNAYQLALSENDQLMEKLAECLKDASNQAGENIHWGHANYVQIINCKLAECVRYLQAIEVASGIAASQQD